MSAPAGYFVAPNAIGDMWIWREDGEAPHPVVSCFVFRDDPALWDYFTSGMPVRVEGAT